MELYRGTRREEVKGVRKSVSYTPSLPVAIIWSSRPPDVWGQREASFLPTSTVHIARLNTDKILELSSDNHDSFLQILRALKYGVRGGLDHDEMLKILQYLHNRLIGRAKGGEFSYRVEGIEEEDIPFSLMDPKTTISELKWELEGISDKKEVEQEADRLIADTFIFADAPAVQRAAVNLGYKALYYPDVFQGGEFVAPKLLGIDVYGLQGVERQWDLEMEKVPVHETYRPLVAGAIIPVESVLTRDLLATVSAEQLEKSA